MATATSLRCSPTGPRSLPTRACRWYARTRPASRLTADGSGMAAAPCSTAETAPRGGSAETASAFSPTARPSPATTRLPSRIAGASGTPAAGRWTARATVPAGPALAASACRRDACPSPAARTPGAGSTVAARSATAAVACSTAVGRARASGSLAKATCASTAAAAASPTIRARSTPCPHLPRYRRPRRCLLAHRRRRRRERWVAWGRTAPHHSRQRSGCARDLSRSLAFPRGFDHATHGQQQHELAPAQLSRQCRDNLSTMMRSP